MYIHIYVDTYIYICIYIYICVYSCECLYCICVSHIIYRMLSLNHLITSIVSIHTSTLFSLYNFNSGREAVRLVATQSWKQNEILKSDHFSNLNRKNWDLF